MKFRPLHDRILIRRIEGYGIHTSDLPWAIA